MTGKQSAIPYRLTLIPAAALERIGEVLTAGREKYGVLPDGRENWEAISVLEHIDHAFYHVTRWQRGDAEEPHLAHAVCRLLFALELSERETNGDK